MKVSPLAALALVVFALSPSPAAQARALTLNRAPRAVEVQRTYGSVARTKLLAGQRWSARTAGSVERKTLLDGARGGASAARARSYGSADRRSFLSTGRTAFPPPVGYDRTGYRRGGLPGVETWRRTRHRY